MLISAVSRHTLTDATPETHSGPLTAITLLDPFVEPVTFPPALEIVRRLDLRVHDVAGEAAGLVVPTAGHAQALVAAIGDAYARGHNLLVVCEMGAGRSRAVAAVAARMGGWTEVEAWGAFLRATPYNRRLYGLMCRDAGLPITPEPLVSVVVRVKYPLDRLQDCLASLRRQRWQHWECVAVTDGPRPDVVALADAQVRVIETPVARGLWGHPYRQVGIDAAQGAYVCCQNDDNLLTPGYLEQLASHLLYEHADLATCRFLLNYFGWTPVTPTPEGTDVGAWMARRALVAAEPWPGTDFKADTRYVNALRARAGKIVDLDSCLYVHN